jgi:hypothetical protein
MEITTIYDYKSKNAQHAAAADLAKAQRENAEMRF